MTTLSTEATFGELLRRWRRSCGLSQSEFGQLLDPKAGASSVSCWENDIRRPSWRFLGQIVSITGIPANFALGIQATGPEGSPQ
jgi:transcriptional regulator with XRE-family HTH domain